MTAAEKGYAGRPMTAESTTPPATAAAPREKTAIPKNPGRRDLGLKATLIFPDREIVETFYVPIIYTACRTCYSEQEPEIIFERALAGDFDPLKMQKLISGVIESGHGSTIEHVVFTFAISGASLSTRKAASGASCLTNVRRSMAISLAPHIRWNARRRVATASRVRP